MSLPFDKVKKVIIVLASMTTFSYIGVRLEKYLEVEIQNRKNAIAGAAGKPLTQSEIVGKSRFNWISLLEKHKRKIPYIMGFVGTLTGSSIILLDGNVYKYLISVSTPSTLYKKILPKKRYFGQMRDFSYNPAQKRDIIDYMIKVVDVIDSVAASTLAPESKQVYYENMISNMFQKKRLTPQVVYTLVAFVSVLTYLFNSNFLIFSELITALFNLIKSGVLSKQIGLVIRQMLRMKGITLPTELDDLEP